MFYTIFFFFCCLFSVEADLFFILSLSHCFVYTISCEFKLNELRRKLCDCEPIEIDEIRLIVCQWYSVVLCLRFFFLLFFRLFSTCAISNSANKRRSFIKIIQNLNRFFVKIDLSNFIGIIFYIWWTSSGIENGEYISSYI